MKLTITATPEFLHLQGLLVRVWRAQTPGGHACDVLVAGMSDLRGDQAGLKEMEAALRAEGMIPVRRISADAEAGPERPGEPSLTPLDDAVADFLPKITAALAAHEADCRKPGCDARAAVLASIIQNLGLKSGSIITALAMCNQMDREGQAR